jgi:hypothetical protein
MPKAEKGFEISHTHFSLGPKEEGQLKVGWVPQHATPLRETVYIKFGKLKTQMLFVATCKVPPGMLEQRKPLRPSSVQNLKRQQPSLDKTMVLKKKLPANPVTRAASGVCPPVRPYVQDQPENFSKPRRESMASWSPQPFRMASEEAFDVSSVKENLNLDSVASPRRDTFVIPKRVNDETMVRRETFIAAGSGPMVTSTPRCGPPQENFLTPDDRRQTYVLPSTVKKPLEPQEPPKHAETIEAEDETTVVHLSDIKEEEEPASRTLSKKNVDEFLEISGVDLSLSPEKKDLSGLDVLTNQTLSLPPKPSSNIKLQLSNGDTSEVSD